ncbi:MAG: AAA family ATPase [Bacteroidales bacterium]|jgi:predicted ATPase|nr:AAA family ATPase [Bacteroidales bacterium]
MIKFIEIEGYKSIKELKMEMKPLNILIGSNGSGKSNFISFFKLLNAIANGQLQRFLREEDVDKLLYFGRKTTSELYGKVIFTEGESNNAYYFNLAQTNTGGLFIGLEGSGYNVDYNDDSQNYFNNYNLEESKFARSLEYPRNRYLNNYLTSFRVFHFHDTSSTSLLRKACDISDNRYLKPDGRNLPAMLYLLQEGHPKIFSRIIKVMQSVAPYISKFILEPSSLNRQEIELRWIDKGDLESNFSAYQLSDGTLRFIALAVLLMQPDPPAVIIIDEPELGLHPFAIGKLAGMMQAASSKAQIIAATQSPGLISNFSPDDVIVIDKSESENQTIFNRLNTDSLKNWLEDYTLGDLWERNIINAAQPFRK